MNKTLLIVRHEFLNLVKRKGFIIWLVAFPVIGFSAIGIYMIVQGIGTGDRDIPIIGYVDEFGGFSEYTTQGELVFISFDTIEEATDALLAEEIDEYFVIPADYLVRGVVDRYVLEKELDIPSETRSAMISFLQSNLLEGQTSLEITERVKSPMLLSSIRLDESGNYAEDQGGVASFIVPTIFAFLLVMAIASSSGYLLQGLGEEKENRVMEVLLSSVSPQQLLTGKVLGLGAGGLLQVLVWLGSLTILSQLASNIIGGVLAGIQLSGNILLLGMVYFILGYLLFAVIQAGMGAVGANAKDSQQMVVALMLPAILPFYIFIFFLRDNPDHVVGTVLTLIPVTAPMSVFVRLGLSEIPLWELLVSIGLMIAGIVGGIFLAAKAFRVFLLMYGKTPGPREIIRYLRES
ncbi:MAG: ABC transporter permease [Dehalococcoidales bacterium]|nr:MAG: ABC transporter permease [Dehalococcoidales bacterium]